MSIADQEDACKLGSVCNALPPVPWSQLRSETKEHFIGWCCQPLKYSILRFFFFPNFLLKERKHIFSPIITRLNIYHRLLIKLLRYSTSWKFPCIDSRSHFPTWTESLQLVLQLFSSSITGHFHLYLLQQILPSFFTCSSISVLTDWQAEKGKSKFITRKEWEKIIISHFS